MAYYTLATRDAPNADYAPQFGDHSREIVVAERADYRDHGHRMADMAIVKTRTARQGEIDEAIATLNANAALIRRQLNS